MLHRLVVQPISDTHKTATMNRKRIMLTNEFPSLSCEELRGTFVQSYLCRARSLPTSLTLSGTVTASATIRDSWHAHRARPRNSRFIGRSPLARGLPNYPGFIRTASLLTAIRPICLDLTALANRSMSKS